MLAGLDSKNLRKPNTHKYPTAIPTISENYGPKNIQKMAISTRGYHFDLI